MPKIISANFVKNEEHCISEMLDCVKPWVEECYVLIDDTTTDSTEDICKSYGCFTKKFKFENFGKAWNTLLQWINKKSDWTLFVAPDETIERSFGEALLPLVEDMHGTDIDACWFTRRHWKTKDRSELFEKDSLWLSHVQCRLIRNDYPRIHAVHYVHEVMSGLRRSIISKGLEIHHHNAYYKPLINYNWDEMNQLYNRLAKEQKADGGKNIFPT